MLFNKRYNSTQTLCFVCNNLITVGTARDTPILRLLIGEPRDIAIPLLSVFSLDVRFYICHADLSKIILLVTKLDTRLLILVLAIMDLSD